MEDGELYLRWGSAEDTPELLGPFDIGHHAEDVYIDDYDAETGTGELFFAVLIEDPGQWPEMLVWITFPDGSSTAHVAVEQTEG